MRWLILLCGVIWPLSTWAAEYAWPVTGVIDGDTLRVRLAGLPPELRDVSVRVVGVDTPEKGGRAKCPAERALGERATAFVAAVVFGRGQVHFEPLGWDKYGGRIDAIVRVNGQDLAKLLIRAGLGRPYDGGKREGWC